MWVCYISTHCVRKHNRDIRTEYRLKYASVTLLLSVYQKISIWYFSLFVPYCVVFECIYVTYPPKVIEDIIRTVVQSYALVKYLLLYTKSYHQLESPVLHARQRRRLESDVYPIQYRILSLGCTCKLYLPRSTPASVTKRASLRVSIYLLHSLTMLLKSLWHTYSE